MPLMPQCLHPGLLGRLTVATVVPIWAATLMLCQTSIADPIMPSDPANDSLEYQEALRLQREQPDSPDGHILEGDVWMVRSEPEKALAAYERGQELAPSGRTTVGRFQALRALRDATAAERSLVDWLADYPDDVEVRQVLADARLQWGDAPGAIAAYEKVLALDDHNKSVLNNLAWLYLGSDEAVRALAVAERAYRAAATEPLVLDTYGWILVQNGRTEEGIATLRHAVQADPDNPEPHYHLAISLYERGAVTAAIQEITFVVESPQDFSEKKDAMRLLRKWAK